MTSAVNDGGKNYPQKKESAKICLDFFGVPQERPTANS